MRVLRQRMQQGRSAWKPIVITLALALVFAFIVNWGVLQLFGQHSADRAEHSLVGIILLMAYIGLFTESPEGRGWALGDFFLALIPCYIGTVLPDWDIRFLGIGGHRNPLFHSSLSFVILWLGIGRKPGFCSLVALGYGVGLASHLWWDVIDYGDVRWLPGGTIDRLWLGVHGLLCLVLPSRLYHSRYHKEQE